MLVKPQELDAERAVIKCILEDVTLFYDCGLVPETFFGIENRLVFEVISELGLEGRTPDFVLVKNALEQTGRYKIIGGDSYFELLASTEVLPSNFDEYSKLIVDAHISRNVIDAGTKIRDAGYTKPAETAVGVAYEETGRLLDFSTGGNSIDLSTLMVEEMVALNNRLLNPGSDGIPTRFVEYDHLLGGFYKTDEIIIAARPSVGKTALALRLMLNIAKQGRPVQFFSYEMSHAQLRQRLLAMEAGVDFSRIRQGMLDEAGYSQVVSAANSLGKLPIYIYNKYSATISELVAETRKLVRDKGIEVAIVDYIQLIPHRAEYATQDLGALARVLKNLAMDADIVTVLISQLNRAVEMQADKRPMLHHLRQSGNLEEHADLVLMLYRDELYNATDTNKGTAELLIRKNRNGPIGDLKLKFIPRYVDFRGGI